MENTSQLKTQTKNKKEKNIEHKVLMTLNRQLYAKGKFKHELQVVEYTIDGVLRAPKIEKRGFIKEGHEPHTHWKRVKISSLSFKDAEDIVKNWPKLKNLMLGTGYIADENAGSDAA